MEMNIIKKDISNNILDNISISNMKNQELKVAAYVRVSTEMECQDFSFSSQYKHYYQKIDENSKWSFAGIYAEKGKTGTSTKKREQFNLMIKNAMNGNIDLIITKSISRFARNTVDTLHYVRMLKEKNVGVYFEEERIYTLGVTSEMLISVL